MSDGAIILELSFLLCVTVHLNNTYKKLIDESKKDEVKYDEQRIGRK